MSYFNYYRAYLDPERFKPSTINEICLRVLLNRNTKVRRRDRINFVYHHLTNEQKDEYTKYLKKDHIKKYEHYTITRLNALGKVLTNNKDFDILLVDGKDSLPNHR